jgi:hypothetical protein
MVMRALRITSPVSAATTRPLMIPVGSDFRAGESRTGACAKPAMAKASTVVETKRSTAGTGTDDALERKGREGWASAFDCDVATAVRSC